MSHEINTELMERASYVKTQYEGTLLDYTIDGLIERNDLEKLEYIICEAEADLAKEEFYAEDVA